MFDINSDDMLSKIHQYKLTRTDGWCYIVVHEVIASQKAKIHFIAVPNLVVQDADKQYFGTGESVDSALADCLEKIKSISITTLFPNLDEPYKPFDPPSEQNE
jgi:hypothetical protein